MSHYDGGKRRIDTWAARCMSSGGRVGIKDAILESGQATRRVCVVLVRGTDRVGTATFVWRVSVDSGGGKGEEMSCGDATATELNSGTLVINSFCSLFKL